MSFEDIQKKDRSYISPTYNRFSADLSTGGGATVYSESGKRYVDFGSGIAVNIFGVADPQWEAAVCEQAGKMAIRPIRSPLRAGIFRTGRKQRPSCGRSWSGRWRRRRPIIPRSSPVCCPPRSRRLQACACVPPRRRSRGARVCGTGRTWCPSSITGQVRCLPPLRDLCSSLRWPRSFSARRTIRRMKGKSLPKERGQRPRKQILRIVTDVS